jgi:NAD(P) transhydrogenase subunit alpha
LKNIKICIDYLKRIKIQVKYASITSNGKAGGRNSRKNPRLVRQIKRFSNRRQVSGGGIDPLVFAITIFVLASFVGYYVVWKVTPALHTPLMSITNAISGIIVISSMIAASSAAFSFSTLLGYFATFLASINIFGGFIVTERMLEMFKKK